MRGRYEASGLVPLLAFMFLGAFWIFAFLTAPERKLMGSEHPVPLWREVLRLTLSWAVMSGIVVTAAIGLDLAATDHEPGMSTAPVAVIIAPMMSCVGALLVYVMASMQIKRKESPPQ